MKRLIFVSFGFLAFAFYEFSGGADFQPRLIANPVAANTVTTEPLPDTRPVPVKAASLIASPAIAPRTSEPAAVAFVTPPEPAFATGPLQEQTPPVPANANPTNANPTNANPIAQPLVLASLEQGLVGLTTALRVKPAPEPTRETAVFTPSPADIREITATRVNMRDGPGTTYPVLTRLTLGHTVEILDAPGNGWLRLRTLPEERVGWISASLVSKASR